MRDERWLGWGYLGERRRSGATPERIAEVDAAVLDYANAADWDYEDLFRWANGRLGRWFGDMAFGSRASVADVVAEALRGRLLRVPAN